MVKPVPLISKKALPKPDDAEPLHPAASVSGQPCLYHAAAGILPGTSALYIFILHALRSGLRG